jgi:glucose-1-phosphate thymidylyltransferase
VSTRHLAPVANKPVLFHHLDALAAAGIRETAIVCDRRSNAGVRESVGDGSAWGLDVRYVEESPSVDILASRQIADFVGSAPVLVQHGDILLCEAVARLGEQFVLERLDALVMHAGRSFPQPIDGYLIGEGVYRDLIRQTAPLAQALVRLRELGKRIHERDVDANLPCRSGTEGLLAANRSILEAMHHDVGGERIFDTEIQGRVTVDPSAEIRDSLIRGPVAIGPRARIANSYIGPYTSVGPGVEIDCVEIEHSIVLDRARLRFLGTRIEGSLIGPDARIERALRIPQAVRLSGGAGAEVAIA